MTNAEILSLASAANAEWTFMAWTAPNGAAISLTFVPFGEQIFQLRQSNGPADVEVLPFPATEAGLTEARAVARLRAQMLKGC